MKRNFRAFFILLLSFLTTAAIAQQSNKSKSKDRFREKDLNAKSEIVRRAEQNAAWGRFAAGELSTVTNALNQSIKGSPVDAAEASRIYALALLAGHETASRYRPEAFPALRGLINGRPVLNTFTDIDSVYYPLAALQAVLETGKGLLPWSQPLLAAQQQLEQQFRDNGLPEMLVTGSRAAGGDMAAAMLYFAGIGGGTGTLLLESAQQFSPPAPMPADMNGGSRFQELAREVYETGRNRTAQQAETAEFWSLFYTGIGEASPTMPWLVICGTVCEQQQRSFRETLIAHTTLALAAADAHRTCLDAKYRYNRPRPEAIISQYLDPNWRPLLPTPGTPEYAGEWSTVSAAAAEVLTVLLGENVAFTAPGGDRARAFRSFRQAAGDAADAGVFGGIQFRDGANAGLESGRQSGLWVLSHWPKGQ